MYTIFLVELIIVYQFIEINKGLGAELLNFLRKIKQENVWRDLLRYCLQN